ncbi:alpha-galactosidase [Ruminococcaceae bacterium OttesenSCG-928-D13]|nr:alpha-galactosidase [Ruminococcaceae bacterium OttesenSCG-928-D13]
MISIHDNLVEMHTQNTSYILHTGRGLVENLHYGARIKVHSLGPLLPKVEAGFGGDVLEGDRQPAQSSLGLELSPKGRGDYRAGALLAEGAHGGTTTAFTFRTARLLDGPAPTGGMPHGRGPDETVALTLSEAGGLEVELFYSVFYEADVITKRMRITNRAAGPVRLLRALSSQLDLPSGGWELFNLTGAWARETQLTRRLSKQGTLKFGNGTGASGNGCNPFFFVAAPDATETAGEVYGFNLVYSGSHEGSLEQDAFGRTRIMHGLWSEGFSWPLAPGERFTTPEAVLTYSENGKTGMSHNMHRFVKNHILPPRWRSAPRPILINNWEGTYFNFNESKLLGIARTAAKLGVELFVLDDGWFGERNNDKAGLGDYDVNRKKLPGGLKGLAERINGLGMEFGLWFEPEMVNPDSKLYRAHPDWAVQTPGLEPATGRHQLVLDLCRREVREYIIESVNKTLGSANIRYVKWDMNRHLADNFSPALKDQGMFFHAFTLGLYQLFDGICATHPDILFEGCSSGGNRYDLGVLYYMPQMWISDDSDAHERHRIQTGASYGYPPCTMGCHVSAVPNHQTLRQTPLDTRFNTAMFGLLGYELDMMTMTKQQKADVKAQIEFYKGHRALLQYGDFYRLADPFEQADCRWMVVNADKTEAMVGDFLGLLVPNSTVPPMRLRGLDADTLYQVMVRPQKIDIETFGGLINYILPLHLNPDGALVKAAGKVIRLDTEREDHTAYGSALCKAGLSRMQNFSGAGYHEDLRFLTDFASRVYHIKAVAEEDAAGATAGEGDL